MANKDVLLQDNEVILLQDNGTPNNKSALSQNGQKRAPDLTESDIKAAFVEALTKKRKTKCTRCSRCPWSRLHEHNPAYCF